MSAKNQASLEGARYDIPLYQPCTLVKRESEEFPDDDPKTVEGDILRYVWHFTSPSKPDEIKAFYRRALPDARVGEWDLRDDEFDETGDIVLGFEYRPAQADDREGVEIEVYNELKNGLARFSVTERALKRAQK